MSAERCLNCGAAPAADARFCSRCGAPLSTGSLARETCEIALWRGYTKAEFAALPVGAAESNDLPRSPSFRWRKETAPPEEEPYVTAYSALVERLEADGWTASGEGGSWFARRFTRPIAAQ